MQMARVGSENCSGTFLGLVPEQEIMSGTFPEQALAFLLQIN